MLLSLVPAFPAPSINRYSSVDDDVPLIRKNAYRKLMDSALVEISLGHYTDHQAEFAAYHAGGMICRQPGMPPTARGWVVAAYPE